MDCSWASTSGSVPFSINSTVRSGGNERPPMTVDRSLVVEMSLTKGHVDGTIAVVDNPRDLLRGMHQLHTGISALMHGQQKIVANSHVLRRQADAYSEMLERFQNRSCTSEPALSRRSTLNSSESEVETARATCRSRPGLVRSHFSSAQSQELAGSKRTASESLPSLCNHADVHKNISLGTYVGTPLSLGCPTTKDEALNVTKNSALSTANSYLLDKPLASSSPACSKLSKQVADSCNEASTSSKLTTTHTVTLRKPTFKNQEVQAAVTSVDRSVEVDATMERHTKKKTTTKKVLQKERTQVDAAVQVSSSFQRPVVPTEEQTAAADEGFSEPTEFPSSSLSMDRNIKGCNKCLSQAVQFEQLPTAASEAADCLAKKKSFVLGTSTSNSHSIYITTQQLMHALKVSEPSLYALLSKGQVPPTAEQFLNVFIANVQKEIARLYEEIRNDIRIYDDVNEELLRCNDGKRASELCDRQAFSVGRITNNDFQVRRLEAKIDAARKDLQRMADKTTPRSYRLCDAYEFGWLRPTLSSRVKAYRSTNTTTGVQLSAAERLRDIKTIKQFVDRNNYIQTS